MADAEDWLNDMGLDGQGDEDEGDTMDDDWMNEATTDTAPGADGEDMDWMGGDAAGLDAEAMLAAGQPDQPKPEAAPKEAQDPTRAKHIQKQKMRAAEAERSVDAAVLALEGTPLDDPEAEKARIKKLQELKEMEIMKDTLAAGNGDGDDNDDEDDDGNDGSATTASSAGHTAATPAATLPKKLPDWVDMMPIKGKGWVDVGGLLIEKAEASKSRLDTGKLIKGVIRAAVTDDVLTKSDIEDIRVMLSQAESNLQLAATAKAQGRTKKKKKTKLGRKGQQVGGGKSGYTKVTTDADMMDMAVAASSAPAPAPAAVEADEDDDDFM